MKRTFTAVASLLLAIIICFLGVYTLNKTCEELRDKLTELSISLKTDSKNIIIQKTDETITLWEKSNRKLEVLTKHAETDELEEIIKSLSLYAQTDDKEKLFEETQFAINKLEHIKNNEKICINNIL